MTSDITRLIAPAGTVVFALYGISHIISEIFVSIFPFGILLIIALVLAINIFKVPAPQKEAVESIIGKDLFEAECHESNVTKTIAHRGAGLDAPENSLLAFKLCSEKGCDVVEFDVTLTSDGVPIVFHDETLERMADSTLVVNNTKWEELSTIDISVKHPFRERFNNINIPTLEQAVSQLLQAGQKMFIDIKDNNTKMVPVILQLFEKYPDLISRAVVTSFFPNIIYMIRRKNPQIVGCLAFRPHSFANKHYKYPEGKGPRRTNVWYKYYLLVLCDILHLWALPRITYHLLGLSIVLVHKDMLSPETILQWKKKGVQVAVWTVNSPIEKQHIARNLKIAYLTDTLTGENTAHGQCS